VMHGDHVTGHQMGDRVVSFHGGEITMKRLPTTSPRRLAMRGRMLRQSIGQEKCTEPEAVSWRSPFFVKASTHA
jgi:hypothetical protein